MTTPYKAPQGEGKAAGEETVRVHRIRITLTSKNVANLEKGAPPPLPGRRSRGRHGPARRRARNADASRRPPPAWPQSART